MAMEKTFDAAEAEQRLYSAWEESGAFAAGAGPARANPDARPFSVMIPPPNVTGSLHMGHAFNNTLQDILVRWKRMQGFDTLWQPGTDHAGIATQMVTERDMAANGEPDRRDMGRDDFLARVWQQKIKSRGTIIGQLKRLGASCDWSREAFTMSGAPGAPEGEEGNFHDAVIKVFVEMYDKGLIYRGKRLVNWDPQFETAISDLEVENIDTAGHMWHFKYPLAGGETYTYVERDADGNTLFEEIRDYISIATTRPETMLGDGAVAVHPEDDRYAPIVGKLCEIPIGPKEHRRLIPIITDEYPDRTFGSGAVKITGAHDFNDYAVAKRGNIPCYRLMDTRAQMRDDGAPYEEEAAKAQAIIDGAEFTESEIDSINLVPEAYRGLDRFEAREAVIADITAEGLAVMTPENDPRLGKAAQKPLAPEEGGEAREDTLVPLVEAKMIMQPFGDRSKVVIEPMLTDQWFVDTGKIVGPALDAVRNGDVAIVPQSGEKTYFNWLENIEPWCISRQLWWGHQIPVWHTPGLGGEWRSFCAVNEEEALRQMHDFFGDEAEFLLVEDAAAAEDMLADLLSQGTDYTGVDQRRRAQAIPVFRDPDVLDTWFSSGLWPIGTLGWPEQTPELRKYFPTSTLITGQDIIFFWVARMMMMQLAVVDEVPFKTVYLHGLVRDAKGKKMSKSLGNVVDPLDLIDEFGADALRFTNAAMASLGGALKLDTQRIAGYRNFSTKLWNACRFAEMNGVFDGATGQRPTPGQTANKWIIGETAKVLAEVNDAFESYRFNDAASALYAFVWGRVCDWYVEFSKPLFDSQDAEIIAETRATMAWVLDQCLILLHPIMPFITEELWGTLATRDHMLIHADWPTYQANVLVDAQADSEMTWVISLIDGVRSARAQMHVPAGLKVPMLVTDLDAAGQAAWQRNEALIMRLARIDSLEKTADFPKGCVTVPVAGGTFGLPLAGIIDVAEEKARLEKTLGKLGKEIGGLKGRLNNPKFAESAPDEVVAEARENLAAREEEESTLRAALARLAELG
ncbi:valine--tRNA ligase [Puniceibacterium confluentis]|uniref:valine--tRNA ligase n=1 Tax=Puniceibacterium confluentis TaxID=1958944 RepID=UPI0011B4CDFC|nr:valine--tRNA ligase [Puniceibacterium confluentis]